MTPLDLATGIVTAAGISISLSGSLQTNRRSATRLVVVHASQPARRRCLRCPRIIRDREFSRRRIAIRLHRVPSLIRVPLPAVVPVLHRGKGSVLTLVVRLPDDNLSVVIQEAMTVPSLRGIIHQLAARRHRKATARKAGPASRTTSLNPTST